MSELADTCLGMRGVEEKEAIANSFRTLAPHNTPVRGSKFIKNFFWGRRECKAHEGLLGKVCLRAGPGTASAYEVQNESEFIQSQRDDDISSHKYRPLPQQMWCCLELEVLSLARETPFALFFSNSYNV